MGVPGAVKPGRSVGTMSSSLSSARVVPPGAAPKPSTSRRALRLVVRATKPDAGSDGTPKKQGRREFMLNSSSAFTLASMFTIGAAKRPNTIGVQDVYGSKQLNLCPPTPNCVSTAEEANDLAHYIPQWTYNPEEGRGKKAPVTQAEAMAELRDVIESIKPDDFTPRSSSRRMTTCTQSFRAQSSGSSTTSSFSSLGASVTSSSIGAPPALARATVTRIASASRPSAWLCRRRAGRASASRRLAQPHGFGPF